jgi:cytochrome c oxidase cbb3-type subunit I/II
MGTFGILLYVAAMYVSGITQGLMWRAEAEGGGLLYPNFVETIEALRPMYWMRLIGGSLYLGGFILMAGNLGLTALRGRVATASVEVAVTVKETPSLAWTRVVFAPPVLWTALVGALVGGMIINQFASVVFGALAFAAAIFMAIAFRFGKNERTSVWHGILEGRALIFTVLTVVAVLIGGIAELVPTIVISTRERGSSPMQPYSALELEGRDVYVSEGCYTCHSQMIRPFGWEAARYGQISAADDSLWDHPFQWGSKRNGPDLAREGGRYPDVWHVQHMMDPRSTSPGSIMPAYPHLASSRVDFSRTRGKLFAMQALGVPYSDADVAHAERDARAEGRRVAADLADQAEVHPDSQLVALVAYLQRLGQTEPRHPVDRTPEGQAPERPIEISRAGGGR